MLRSYLLEDSDVCPIGKHSGEEEEMRMWIDEASWQMWTRFYTKNLSAGPRQVGCQAQTST